eukprot:m.100949 g.100949  ORF g.100949 m.100949 type:complete len:301 (-) comp27291_c0_seq2:158-1060(-)
MSDAIDYLDNLRRQLDEIEAIEAIAMATARFHTSDTILAKLRAHAEDSEQTSIGLPEISNQLLDFSIPVSLLTEDTSKPMEANLRVILPAGYPSHEVPKVSCSLESLSSKKLRQDLSDGLEEFMTTEVDLGDESLLTIMQFVSDKCLEVLLRVAEEDESKAKAKVELSQSDAEWRRWFFWVDHLLQGKQHKKEAKIEGILQACGMPAKIYFGRPGIIGLEGVENDVNEVVRDCSKAGKVLKVKKSQLMVNKEHDCFFPMKVASVAATKTSSLDLDTVQADLTALGLEHKIKHILGVEHLQ